MESSNSTFEPGLPGYKEGMPVKVKEWNLILLPWFVTFNIYTLDLGPVPMLRIGLGWHLTQTNGVPFSHLGMWNWVCFWWPLELIPVPRSKVRKSCSSRGASLSSCRLDALLVMHVYFLPDRDQGCLYFWSLLFSFCLKGCVVHTQRVLE